MIIGGLHLHSGQTIDDLVDSSSVSRATAYRTLRRLALHGLVRQSDQTWTLTPRALAVRQRAGPGRTAGRIQAGAGR
ncbi:helix-turn-helix domain-containing protein [Streptomyces phaeochromogenes]|uniref:helix-turn-helix domain-containing protein n=1 Tax=Streptomyces phaeochromogenes TaxID=1923 RepID=UPI0036A16F90